MTLKTKTLKTGRGDARKRTHGLGILIGIILTTALLAANDRAFAAGGETRAVSPAEFSVSERATIKPTDSHFSYSGRIDLRSRLAPVLVWQCSEVAIGFEGTELILQFAHAKGQNVFDLQVDGVSRVVEVKEGAEERIPFPGRLAAGRHQLTLFKRSEAAAGTVAFVGLELAPHASVFPSSKQHYGLRMEFIGDSITVGACNEDGEADQWENRRTHNSGLSYAALTAKALGAEHRNIAVSGMGIVKGYVAVKAVEVWNALSPAADSAKADLRAWIPQIVCVNFGENDSSFTRAHGEPFPPSFTADYITLIHEIRRGYPDCEIVLLRGGMGGGHGDPALLAAWTAAVEKLEREDRRVHHYVFEHWSMLHPRVADDTAMADELVGWFRQQPFFKAIETSGKTRS